MSKNHRDSGRVFRISQRSLGPLGQTGSVENQVVDQFLNDGITIEETAVSERPGTVVGGYRLLLQIGKGAMGLVCMAAK